MEVEAEVGAQDVVAQQAHLLRLGDGRFQAGDRQRVLRADVDIALVAAGGYGGDEHSLDDGVGVALHDGAVHEGAGVAFVAVAHHILLPGGLETDALPLAAGGEAAAAPGPGGRSRRSPCRWPHRSFQTAPARRRSSRPGRCTRRCPPHRWCRSSPAPPAAACDRRGSPRAWRR